MDYKISDVIHNAGKRDILEQAQDRLKFYHQACGYHQERIRHLGWDNGL